MNEQEIISILNEYLKYNEGLGYSVIEPESFPSIAERLKDDWVSVGERLPEINQFVLGCYPFGRIPIIFCYKGDNNWLAVDGELWLTEEVTFWRNLPTPPNPEK